MKGKQIRQLASDSLKALFKGELLLRMGVDKYFIHIMYAFLLALMMIWVNVRVDAALVTVEQNKAVLEELRIRCAQRTGELSRMDRISTVQDQLRLLDSPLEVPTQPATVVKKKR